MNLEFTITESTRVIEYTIEEGNEKTVISIELPEEIKIEDTLNHDHDDEGEECKGCFLTELTEQPEGLHDPVYTCAKCAEGPSLLCFPGEPTFLMSHIEKCLGLEPIESQANDMIFIRYRRS